MGFDPGCLMQRLVGVYESVRSASEGSGRSARAIADGPGVGPSDFPSEMTLAKLEA
jgi:hypothetical protein